MSGCQDFTRCQALSQNPCLDADHEMRGAVGLLQSPESKVFCDIRSPLRNSFGSNSNIAHWTHRLNFAGVSDADNEYVIPTTEILLPSRQDITVLYDDALGTSGATMSELY